MKRLFLAGVLLAVGCKKSSGDSTANTGYVVTFTFAENIPAEIAGFEATISREGGFPTFEARDADGIAVSSDGNVRLIWPAKTDFTQGSVKVRLLLGNTDPMLIAIEGLAKDLNGDTIGRGTTEATVPAGGRGTATVAISCAGKLCKGGGHLDGGTQDGAPDAPEADSGVEPPDAGVDAPEPDSGIEPPDAGVDAGPDGPIVPPGPALVAEQVTGAGESASTSYELRHEVGHTVGRTESSSATYQVESVLTLTR